MLRFLSCDPAKNTFAVSILECTPKNVRVITHRMLDNPVQDLTGDVQSDFGAFITEIRGLVSDYSVGVITAERYMNRGRTGTAIELVSAMLGAMATAVKVDDVMLIPASQWKNAYNRLWDLDDIYERAGKKNVHRLDATLIGAYCSSHYFRIPAYSNTSPQKILRGFLPCLTV